MNAYNYDMIARRHPLGHFGLMFVFENASASFAAQAAAEIGASLQLGEECLRYPTSHGALDREHVEFIDRIISKVTDPHDQQATSMRAM